MSASNARATMLEHADPPVSFGGSGGIVWPLGPNAHSQIPATRRPRTDPSGPSALRLRASGPAVTLVECGRRVDPREWADPPPGLELEGPDIPALPDVDRREMEHENEDEDEDASSSGDDADAGSVDYRAQFEATEAQTALDASSAAPVGIPSEPSRRVCASRRAAREADDPARRLFQRRLGNALAVRPGPGTGAPETLSLKRPRTSCSRALRARAQRAFESRVSRAKRRRVTEAMRHRGATPAERRFEKKKKAPRLRVSASRRISRCRRARRRSRSSRWSSRACRTGGSRGSRTTRSPRCAPCATRTASR